MLSSAHEQLRAHRAVVAALLITTSKLTSPNLMDDRVFPVECFPLEIGRECAAGVVVGCRRTLPGRPDGLRACADPLIVCTECTGTVSFKGLVA